MAGTVAVWGGPTTAPAVLRNVTVALIWLAGMLRADLFFALAPPYALLFASAAAGHFFGYSLRSAFLSALVVGLISLGLSYAFCEDWRQLFQKALARGRRFGAGLILSFRRTQTINTSPQD